MTFKQAEREVRRLYTINLPLAIERGTHIWLSQSSFVGKGSASLSISLTNEKTGDIHHLVNSSFFDGYDSGMYEREMQKLKHQLRKEGYRI